MIYEQWICVHLNNISIDRQDWQMLFTLRVIPPYKCNYFPNDKKYQDKKMSSETDITGGMRTNTVALGCFTIPGAPQMTFLGITFFCIETTFSILL